VGAGPARGRPQPPPSPRSARRRPGSRGAAGVTAAPPAHSWWQVHRRIGWPHLGHVKSFMTVLHEPEGSIPARRGSRREPRRCQDEGKREAGSARRHKISRGAAKSSDLPPASPPLLCQSGTAKRIACDIAPHHRRRAHALATLGSRRPPTADRFARTGSRIRRRASARGSFRGCRQTSTPPMGRISSRAQDDMPPARVWQHPPRAFRSPQIVMWADDPKIAHRVIRTTCSLRSRRIIGRSASLPKNADGSLPHFRPSPVSDVPGRARAASTGAPCRPLPAITLPTVRAGTRHEKTSASSAPPPARGPFFRFIADLVARRASPETWRAHHARHRVRFVGGSVAHKTSLGMSGTAEGWKCGRGP
jgi:hypothetical protein